MAPPLDTPEARQLLNAAPMHVHAEPLRHHRAAVGEKARHTHHAPTRTSAAAATPATSTSFSVVPSPSAPNGNLLVTAAIADNDIWLVGYDGVQVAPPAFDSPLAEHFDGTSWSVVPTLKLSSGGINPPSGQFFGTAAAACNDVWLSGSRPGLITRTSENS
jgi:hypothetical protein